MKERAEEKKTWESRRFSDFRQRKQSVFSLKRVEVDIRKSQKACEQLDSAKVCYLFNKDIFTLYCVSVGNLLATSDLLLACRVSLYRGRGGGGGGGRPE